MDFNLSTLAPILLPVFCLVLWSLIMQGWMAATRLPAMAKAKMDPQAGVRPVELANKLPDNVQWIADNYNHLMEQPTIFYATAISLAVLGAGDGLNLMLAWAYVGSRVVHSLVQATVNKVLIRFSLFVFGTLMIIGMAINGVMLFTG